MTNARTAEIEIVYLSVDDLKVTPWNTNEMDDRAFANLTAEIEDGGFDEPLQVVLDKSDGKYWILGGEHRYKAAIGLNYEKIPCVVKHHLDQADLDALKMWSVKRNNGRGKQNAQKYRELEHSLVGRSVATVEAARRAMLVRDGLVKQLKKDEAKASRALPPLDEESLDESENPADIDVRDSGPSDDDDAGEKPAKKKAPSKGSKGPATSEEKDARKELASRTRLLATARAFHDQCLLESGHTVPFGYIFIGANGKEHLIVDESATLHGLVAAMVRACQNESGKIDEFLVSAIRAELKNWE